MFCSRRWTRHCNPRPDTRQVPSARHRADTQHRRAFPRIVRYLPNYPQDATSAAVKHLEDKKIWHVVKISLAEDETEFGRAYQILKSAGFEVNGYPAMRMIKE